MSSASAATNSGENEHDSLWLYFMLALLATAGFFYVNLGAAFGNTLESVLGFTHVQSGTVISANIYGASVGGLIAVFLVRRFHWRPMMVSLLSAVLVIEIISMFVHSYALLLPLRALDGLIGGTSVGIGLALMARTRLPDRAFGMLLLFQFSFGGLGSWLLPELVARYGSWVLFACMAAMDLAAVVVALLLRLRKAPVKTRARAASRATGGHATFLTLAALLALFLFQAANMGLFAFIMPLGEAAALSLSYISQTLGLATWIGGLGAVLVIAFGARMGRTLPLLAAMMLTITCIAGLYMAEYKSIFFIANAGSAITWSFVVPYLFGMVSMLDGSGRLAALAGFVSGTGLATGPLLAGWIASPQGYAMMISAALAFFLIATVSMLAAAVRVDRFDKVVAHSPALAGAEQ